MPSISDFIRHGETNVEVVILTPAGLAVSTFVTLHLPGQKMSARSGQVTFTCEK